MGDDDMGTSSKVPPQQTGSQAATNPQSNSGFNFRKVPELSLVFCRDDDKKSRATRCMKCSKVIITHETDRLMRHVAKCHKIEEKTRDLLLSKFKLVCEKAPISQNKTINLMLCEAFIRLGISFNSVDDLMFREVIKMLNPAFKLATKEELLNLVPQLEDGVYKRIKTKQIIMLQRVENDMSRL